MLSCEIVSEAVPELVTVKVCDLVCPLTTLPKLKLAGLIVNPGCTPVPLTGIASGDPDALLVTDTVPDAFPAVVGANVTDKVTWLDAFKVIGVVAPLTANPVPVTPTAVICTGLVPAFVTTTCFTELLPVETFPKLKLVRLGCSVPAGAVAPVPLRLTWRVGFAGSELPIVRLPLAAPVAVGLNVRERADD